MLGELQITPESYSGHLQPLLIDVSENICDPSSAAKAACVCGGESTWAGLLCDSVCTGSINHSRIPANELCISRTLGGS
jgi:hypothetical protein